MNTSGFCILNYAVCRNPTERNKILLETVSLEAFDKLVNDVKFCFDPGSVRRSSKEPAGVDVCFAEPLSPAVGWSSMPAVLLPAALQQDAPGNDTRIAQM